MMFLAILFFFLIYLAVSFGAVVATSRWAKRNGQRAWVWGGLVAFIMYNLVFWDFIPTLVMHKYYCSTEAGFWVYKTPEQWVGENPGVREMLTTYSDGRSYNISPFHIMYPINQRISWHHKISKASFNIGKFEDVLIDQDKEFVLAKSIYFRSGRCSGAPHKLADFKFFIARCACEGEPFINNYGYSFNGFANLFRFDSIKEGRR